MGARMNKRSSKPEVRNPVLSLPAVQALRASPERHLLIALLLDIQGDARARADKCWDAHKGPMALYWKCIGVYSGHIARALK